MRFDSIIFLRFVHIVEGGTADLIVGEIFVDAHILHGTISDAKNLSDIMRTKPFCEVVFASHDKLYLCSNNLSPLLLKFDWISALMSAMVFRFPDFNQAINSSLWKYSFLPCLK